MTQRGADVHISGMPVDAGRQHGVPNPRLGDPRGLLWPSVDVGFVAHTDSERRRAM
jgi:hypothetical protein